MPDSIPQVQFLTPPGLQLAYLGQVAGANGTPSGIAAGPSNDPPIFTDIRGGIFTLLTHLTAFEQVAVPNIRQWWTVFDGAALPRRSHKFDVILEHRGFVSGGVSALPVVPGNNPFYSQSTVNGFNEHDSWGHVLIPNMHNNHRVVSNDEAANPAASVTVEFEIGTAGPYKLFFHGSGQSTSGTGLRNLNIFFDDVFSHNCQFYFNRTFDTNVFAPCATGPHTLGSGKHTLKVTTDANTLVGPWTAFLFYDPNDEIKVAYAANVPRSGTFSWFWNFPAMREYIVLGGFSAFLSAGWGPERFALKVGDYTVPSGSEYGNKFIAINPVFCQVFPALFAAVVPVNAGLQHFWWVGQGISGWPGNYTSDGNCRSTIMLIPRKLIA